MTRAAYDVIAGAAHVPLHGLLNGMVDAGLRLERTLEGGAPTPITFSVRCSVP